MFLVYSLLFTLGVILSAPYYLWRLRGNILSSADWRERLGFLPSIFPEANQDGAADSIWVHAVSVGETLAAASLIEGLRREFPECRVFVSCVTVAGRAVAEKRFPDVAGHFYLPLDWRASARRVMQRLRPALLLIVETELWPNLLRAAHESGTRVALVNARLSDRSFRGYRLAAPFMRRLLEYVDWIGAQTPRDAERFVLLGARPDRVKVAGNLKFDGKPPQTNPFTSRLRMALAKSGCGPVLVAGSTMPGEEVLVLQAWREIRAQYPRSILVLAPRHANRFNDVKSLFAREGLSVARRTALESDAEGMAPQLMTPQVLLLDTLGELAAIFELADVVFVGGSLVPTGGHNLLEPAYWGKAILFGPHMENFRDIAQQFTEEGAALQVQSALELAQAAVKLLADEDERRKMGQRAKQLVQEGTGATGRTLEEIRILLGVPARSQPHV